MEVTDSLFIFLIIFPPSSPCIAQLTPHHHRAVLVFIFQMWPIIPLEWFLNAEAGGREEGKEEEEERQDLILQGLGMRSASGQDVPSCPLCYMAFSL